MSAIFCSLLPLTSYNSTNIKFYFYKYLFSVGLFKRQIPTCTMHSIHNFDPISHPGLEINFSIIWIEDESPYQYIGSSDVEHPESFDAIVEVRPTADLPISHVALLNEFAAAVVVVAVGALLVSGPTPVVCRMEPGTRARRRRRWGGGPAAGRAGLASSLTIPHLLEPLVRLLVPIFKGQLVHNVGRASDTALALDLQEPRLYF